MSFPTRTQQLASAQAEVLDVCVVGGGVNGASVFRELGDAGVRTLLVDRGDFCARTSQASGMLIWGGLLYLKNMEFRTVGGLCRERDRLIAEDAGHVRPMGFRYLPLRGTARKRWLVKLALQLYWLLGRRRPWPGGASEFASRPLLRANRFEKSLTYEEAGVLGSDAQMVTSWITDRMGADQVALNHCSLEQARFDKGAGLWILELFDRHRGVTLQARARVLVNAAGVWTDPLAQRLGLSSPYRHVLSKGMYLNLPCPPSLQETLVFETEHNGDSMTLTPWGPVALWGPTEGLVDSIEAGFTPSPEDLRFLLDQAGNNLATKPSPSEVVSLRCGIRPLAVKRAYSSRRYPLSISRRHLVVRHRRSPALSIYGGKITSAALLARQVLGKLRAYDLPRRSPAGQACARPLAEPKRIPWPGLDQAQISPEYARDHQACLSLEDYLRRRTNIAQWIPRLGLGRNDEQSGRLQRIAHTFHPPAEARAALAALTQAADAQDKLLATL